MLPSSGAQDHPAASRGWGCLETPLAEIPSPPSAAAALEAGRQRPPINREIQVSEEPSGSLATGAEVGQCPQWAAARTARRLLLPSPTLTRKVNGPCSLSQASACVASASQERGAPLAHLGKLRPGGCCVITPASGGGAGVGAPGLPDSASHLTAGPFPGAQRRAWGTPPTWGAEARQEGHTAPRWASGKRDCPTLEVSGHLRCLCFCHCSRLSQLQGKVLGVPGGEGEQRCRGQAPRPADRLGPRDLQRLPQGHSGRRVPNFHPFPASGRAAVISV